MSAAAKTPVAGDRFRAGRRRAVVREVTAEVVRYSLLRGDGTPSRPVYALRLDADGSVEVIA